MNPHRDVTDLPPQLALIADPRPEADYLYRSVLVPRRYVVDRADTGADVLAKAVAAMPDVVVLHTRTPVIDGFAVCELLRADPATRCVPILMVTDQESEITQARAVGATAVLGAWELPERLWIEVSQLRDDAKRLEAQSQTSSGWLQPLFLRCPICDAGLEWLETHLGGVKRHPERWDSYQCPSCRDEYEYRHRTRQLRFQKRT